MAHPNRLDKTTQSILDSFSQEGLQLTDLNGNLLYQNPVWFRLLELEEHPAVEWHRHILGEEKDRVVSSWKEFQNTNHESEERHV